MALREGESFLDYKKRVIDPISSSFCAAKWLNATMWLDRGWTTSCHLPPHHLMNKREVSKNPAAIHNTIHKKQMRQLMLKGERPKECDYCWKIEDLGGTAVSDRVFKTMIYSDEDIQKISKLDFNKDVNLRTLEISFDRVCNFACSYCNSGFSTTWAKDIKTNGPYQKLWSYGTKIYKVDGSYGQLDPNSNPYIEGFWKWWPELSQSLQELRISGGEPLMSPELWRLLDYFKDHKLEHLRLAVNSNLGASDELIQKFIEKSHHIPLLDVYTSNESYGAQAEYIRDGLNYERWRKNIFKLKQQGHVQSVHIMMTINALCLFSITQLFDDILNWRQELGPQAGVWTLNLLRFPSFMSPLVLPKHLRQERAEHLENWLEKNKTHSLIHKMEVAGVNRLIQYLKTVKQPHNQVSSLPRQQSDFKSFYTQYDQRRKKSITQVFPQEFIRWFKSLDVQKRPLSQFLWPKPWYFTQYIFSEYFLQPLRSLIRI